MASESKLNVDQHESVSKKKKKNNSSHKISLFFYDRSQILNLWGELKSRELERKFMAPEDRERLCKEQGSKGILYGILNFQKCGDVQVPSYCKKGSF